MKNKISYQAKAIIASSLGFLCIVALLLPEMAPALSFLCVVFGILSLSYTLVYDNKLPLYIFIADIILLAIIMVVSSDDKIGIIFEYSVGLIVNLFGLIFIILNSKKTISKMSLIGIVTLITISACGDRKKDSLLSRTFTNAIVPANSNPIWIKKTDSSFLLQLPIDTTFDGVADINVLIEDNTTTTQPTASIVLAILFHRNQIHSFGNVILERKPSGVYLRKIN